MKRMKLPATLAVALLACGAFIANKVNAKKFISANVFYQVSPGVYHTLFAGVSSSEIKGLTTVVNSGQTAKIQTAGAQYTLVTAKSGTARIWYNK